jgi:DNA-binding PadR family transcriptional regulator
MIINLSEKELFVLGIMSRGPTYGHHIKQIISVSYAEQWLSLSDKHVYYILSKLAKQGLITIREERHGNTPPRKVATITEAGRISLLDNLKESALINARTHNAFDAVFAIISYSPDIAGAEALDILKQRRQTLVRRLGEDHPDVPPEMIADRFGRAAWALFDKGHKLLEAEIRWIESVIQMAEDKGWDAMRIPADYIERQAREEEREKS